MDKGYEGHKQPGPYGPHKAKPLAVSAPAGMGGKGRVIGNNGKGRSWSNGPMPLNVSMPTWRPHSMKRGK